MEEPMLIILGNLNLSKRNTIPYIRTLLEAQVVGTRVISIPSSNLLTNILAHQPSQNRFNVASTFKNSDHSNVCSLL